MNRPRLTIAAVSAGLLAAGFAFGGMSAHGAADPTSASRDDGTRHEMSVRASATPVGAKRVSQRRLPTEIYAELLTGAWFGGTFSVGDEAVSLRAWNASSGVMRKWRVSCPENGVVTKRTSAALGDTMVGLVQCAVKDPDGIRPDTYLSKLEAFSLSKGQIKWRKTIRSETAVNIAEIGSDWVVVSDTIGGFMTPSSPALPMYTVNMRTGKWGTTVTGSAKVHSALVGGVLVLNVEYGNASGYSIAKWAKLWAYDSPVSDAEMGLRGSVILDNADGWVVLNPANGAKIAEDLPAASIIDPHGPVAASSTSVLDTKKWKVVWSLYDSRVVAACAGRVWDTLGRVHDAATGKVIARGETTAPDFCVSSTRTAYATQRNGSTWIEIYAYKSR